MAKSDTVAVGKLVGLYGLKGWLKVHSSCRPREQIFTYRPWVIVAEHGKLQVDKFKGKPRGKGLVVHLDGVDDRTAAEKWVDAEIHIERAALPEPEQDSWYWADLIGLEVQTVDGQSLGKVTRMLETGANDVAVIFGDRERLVPFVVGQYIKSVDLESGTMVVDWDPEF